MDSESHLAICLILAKDSSGSCMCAQTCSLAVESGELGRVA